MVTLFISHFTGISGRKLSPALVPFQRSDLAAVHRFRGRAGEAMKTECAGLGFRGLGRV